MEISGMKDQNYAAIMAGGIGSRFWPASRTHLPKQFLDILGIGKTLIQLTYDRFLKICPQEHIFILTNKAYIDLVKEQLPGIADEQILAEPARKNTAPCIAYVAHKINRLDPNGRLIVAPSDHIIQDEEEFCRIALNALEFSAEKAALITLGILPNRPDTGYGYIQYAGDDLGNRVRKVKTFTEKPNLEWAEKFIASGDFLWNAGIFIWSINSIIDAFRAYLPEMNEQFLKIEKDYFSPQEENAISEAFGQCQSISIDFGIMEKAENVYVIPSDFGWSDLGTWASLYAESEKDGHGNVSNSKSVITYEAGDNMIHSGRGKLIVVEGLNDFIVVDTDDALLICKKSSEQKIKEFTSHIKRDFGDKYL